MLTRKSSGEAIRIHFGFALIIGDLIKLTKCLPERLSNSLGENMLAPLLELRRLRRERVPQADLCCRHKIHDFSRSTAELAFVVKAGLFPALLIAEHPDELASDQAK